MQLSLRRISCRGLRSLHPFTITSLSSMALRLSLPTISSQQTRSYLWIVTPEDDDTFYGKYLEDAESEEGDDALVETVAADTSSKNKKVDPKNSKNKSKSVAVKKGELSLKFNLRDYQQMENLEESYDYDEDFFTESLGAGGASGDLEEYLQDEDIELLPGDEYANAYDAQEVDLAIDMHGSDEARNMRTEHMTGKERRKMIQNKIKGRHSSDPVCALVAFANHKRESTMSRRDLKKADEFVDEPGISLDEEYAIYSSR